VTAAALFPLHTLDTSCRGVALAGVEFVSAGNADQSDGEVVREVRPVEGVGHVVKANADKSADDSFHKVVTEAQQPQIIETTDIVPPTPVFAEVDEITMDAVPELPSAYDTGEIDDLGDLNDLFNMNDSQPVQRLEPSRFAPAGDEEKPLAKPPVDMPLTERLRQQAQAKAKKTGNDDQNVGPVK
jgi:cell division transport system ATP-binding protein